MEKGLVRLKSGYGLDWICGWLLVNYPLKLLPLQSSTMPLVSSCPCCLSLLQLHFTRSLRPWRRSFVMVSVFRLNVDISLVLIFVLWGTVMAFFAPFPLSIPLNSILDYFVCFCNQISHQQHSKSPGLRISFHINTTSVFLLWNFFIMIFLSFSHPPFQVDSPSSMFSNWNCSAFYCSFSSFSASFPHSIHVHILSSFFSFGLNPARLGHSVHCGGVLDFVSLPSLSSGLLFPMPCTYLVVNTCCVSPSVFITSHDVSHPYQQIKID